VRRGQPGKCRIVRQYYVHDCTMTGGRCADTLPHLTALIPPRLRPSFESLCQRTREGQFLGGDEDALVKQILQSDKPAYTEPSHVQLAYPDTAIWYSIKDAPYCGSYFMNKSGSYTYFDLAPFHSLARSKLNCSLCGLVFHAIQSLTPPQEIEEILCPSNSVVCWFNNPTMDINSDPSVFEVRIQKEKGVRSDRLILRFTLLGDENEPFARPIINLHQVELNMITHRWKTCESEHGDCCRPLLRSVDVSKPGVDASIANFKVIDVRTSGVVIAPVECTYIALSYVWGNIQAFRLKRADMVLPRHSTRSSGGSYTQLDRQELPRTIRDAMFVVEALGERYLWVDSLCIIQEY